MDISSEASIRQAAATVSEQYGRLDVLINNAGIYLDKNQKLVNLDPSVLEKNARNEFLRCLPRNPFLYASYGTASLRKNY